MIKHHTWMGRWDVVVLSKQLRRSVGGILNNSNVVVYDRCWGVRGRGG